MRWNELAFQPVSRIIAQRAMPSPHGWLSLVHNLGLMRVFGNCVQATVAEGCRPESMIGDHFRPDAEVSLELLQVAGLLLRDEKLNREACALAARRCGGGLYFQWFLAQVDDQVTDPLPNVEFPLHRSRWRKRKAGHAKQRAHS